ncbi:MAG: hypothetical protein JWO20_930 [Candidatus Angelobacter sp.]|nr:hypothetical protein [Candidatus Angelobacter sp.]
MRSNTTLVIARNLIGRDVRNELRCPTPDCNLPELTHVVAVRWERDPVEGDRKRLWMEVRCEAGHGFILLIRNHAGCSFLEWGALPDMRSPFEVNF